jgi:bifunctional non-homologous end joining protein LigD
MIYPQLAKQAELTSLEAFIKDDRWVMEQKLDGNRILMMSPGADMPPTLITRNGSLYSKKVPKAIQDFRFPEGNDAGQFILDGELVGNEFWIFDFIVEGVIDAKMPLRSRRHALEQSFFAWSGGNSSLRLVPQAQTVDEKIRLAEKALANNFEGLLLKDREAPYRSGGRTEEWLKVKFVSTVDCFVTGVRTDGKDSVDLGLLDVDPSRALAPTQIAVGRASLIGKEKNGTINVGDVLEVRYLYCGAGGRLFQPTILRKRDDKRAVECTTQQLKWVNKEVLEAL